MSATAGDGNLDAFFTVNQPIPPMSNRGQTEAQTARLMLYQPPDVDGSYMPGFPEIFDLEPKSLFNETALAASRRNLSIRSVQLADSNLAQQISEPALSDVPEPPRRSDSRLSHTEAPTPRPASRRVREYKDTLAEMDKGIALRKERERERQRKEKEKLEKQNKVVSELKRQQEEMKRQIEILSKMSELKQQEKKKASAKH